jgi:tetratricopeptide (TPR) repeat protein
MSIIHRRYDFPGKSSATANTRMGVPTVLLAALVAGCAQLPPAIKNTSAAASLNAKGIAANDPKQAKEFFQKALAADPYYGPAYNNLGVSLLNESQYFDAAKSFDQAIHLMPNDPEPRIHLGLVYENAGQYQNALEQYNQALVLAPESIDALQALTRVQVRLDQVDEKTVERLRMIAIRGTDATWQAWATRVLIRYGDVAPAQTRPIQ